MLPGGLLVLGVFIITTLEMGNDFQNALRRVSLKYSIFNQNYIFLNSCKFKDNFLLLQDKL